MKYYASLIKKESVISLLLLLSVFLILFPTISVIKAWTETVYIRPDGSVDPPTPLISSVDNTTYVFTSNIYDTIVVERDNIVVDGAGHTLEGIGTGRGMVLSGRSNVTINNLEIKAFEYGVWLEESSSNCISGNSITNNNHGISLQPGSNYNEISGNTVTNNLDGIYISSATSWGVDVSTSSNNSVSGNIVKNNSFGIDIFHTWNNSVYGNIITSNEIGVQGGWASSNSIQGNNVTGNAEGISLWQSSSNIVSGNYIENNSRWGVAICTFDALNNVISGNTLTNNNASIYLWECNDNNIFSNNLINNNFGASLWKSSNNRFYHNNFVNNAQQVLSNPSYANAWDNDYPSGGNYWSNYAGIDEKSGPGQDLLGSDGIGDTPYIIDDGNRDRYPLVVPFAAPPSPPVAYFTYKPTIPKVGLEIAFNASFSFDLDEDIISYRWNFGDGNISSTVDSVIIHTYRNAGRHTITLTVLDNQGLNSSMTQIRSVRMPTFVSISTSTSSAFVGFAVDIDGTLYNVYHNGLESQTVVLYYTFAGANTWVPITSDTTDQLGKYYINWIPPATGYFTVKAVWNGNTTNFGASNTISLSTIPYENVYVFAVESNSTISALAFNSTSLELSFKVSSETGTGGYVKATIANSFISNIEDVKVYLDGNQTEYSATAKDDAWVLTFTYTHSTHQVTIGLKTEGVDGRSPPLLYFIVAVAVVAGLATLILATAYVVRKRKADAGSNINRNRLLDQHYFRLTLCGIFVPSFV